MSEIPHKQTNTSDNISSPEQERADLLKMILLAARGLAIFIEMKDLIHMHPENKDFRYPLDNLMKFAGRGWSDVAELAAGDYELPPVERERGFHQQRQVTQTDQDYSAHGDRIHPRPS